MKKFVTDLLQHLPLEKETVYIEPFAGGAGVALNLLFNNIVTRIHINDLDSSIYSFWYAILNHTEDFIDLIRNTPISIKEWHNQRLIQINKNNYSVLEVGFSTFYLNRTNVSGIIKGGPIGGKKQHGRYKLDCRFNKDKLIKKIRKIAEYSDRITITNFDASILIDNHIREMDPEKTFIFFDPPYYNQGQNLYSNFYNHEDHVHLSNLITSLNNFYWITTYDYSSEIEAIYQYETKKIYNLNYSANKVRKAQELLFLSERITLPDSNNIHFSEST